MKIAALALMLIPTAIAGTAPVTAVPQDAGKSTGGNAEAALREELKAAMFTGLIDRPEAGAIFKALMALETKSPDRQGDRSKGGADAKAGEPVPAWMRFRLPDGRSLTTLLEPEFLPRDMPVLVDRLSIDSATAPVVESLLADYASRFESGRREILDALATVRRQTMLDSGVDVQPLFDAITSASLDRASILARIGNTEGKDSEGAAQWIDWAVDATNRLRDRITAAEAVLAADAVADALSADRAADDALARIMTFRADRLAWRQAIEQDLAAFLSEDELADLEAALNLLRLDHGSRRGRFGGDGVDIEGAVRTARSTTAPAGTPDDETDPELDRDLAELVMLVDARTNARIEAELDALRWYLAGLVGDDRQRDRSARELEDAADTQINAEIAVRDTTLAVVERIRERLAQEAASLADEFEHLVQQAGFPEQMQTRWCEKAVETSLALEDLDDAQRTALETVESGMTIRLRSVRDLAIDERLRVEVLIARAMAEAVIDGYASAKSMDEDTWQEPGGEQFDRLDDEIGAALRGILRPDQLESLPPHASIGTAPRKAEDAKGAKDASTGGKNAGGGSGARGSKRGGKG